MDNNDVKPDPKRLGEISWDKNELALFEQRRKARMDHDRNMAVSRDEGREKVNRKAIKNLVTRGFDNQEIAEILELSCDEVVELMREP